MALIIPTHTGNETPATFEADLKADMTTLEGGLAAVLGGATAQLLPAPSKVPLADGTGQIDPDWMKPVVATVDWNNYTSNGQFFATSLLNSPPQVTGAGLTNLVIVTKTSGTRSLQRAYDINGVSAFERYFLSPNWTPWKPIANIGGLIRVRNSAVQPIAAGAWVQGKFNTVTFNQNTSDLVLNATTGAITTPPWATFAKVTSIIQFDAIAGDSILRITKNGFAASNAYSRRTLVSATETIMFSVGFIVTSGDLIATEIQRISGASVNTTANRASMMVEFI